MIISEEQKTLLWICHYHTISLFQSLHLLSTLYWQYTYICKYIYIIQFWYNAHQLAESNVHVCSALYPLSKSDWLKKILKIYLMIIFSVHPTWFLNPILKMCSANSNMLLKMFKTATVSLLIYIILEKWYNVLQKLHKTFYDIICAWNQQSVVPLFFMMSTFVNLVHGTHVIVSVPVKQPWKTSETDRMDILKTNNTIKRK